MSKQFSIYDKEKSTIGSIQEGIIRDFSSLQGDYESIIAHIMELGRTMPRFLHHERKETCLIKACVAKSWLIKEQKREKLFFRADSDAMVTKGLLQLLVHVFSGHSALDIVASKLFFPERIGLNKLISSRRQQGFWEVVWQIKKFAEQCL